MNKDRIVKSVPKALTLDRAGLNVTAVQKHTKHTLFYVFLCWDSGVRHCVSNLVKEHSSFELSENDLINTIPVSKVLRPQPMYEDICN